MDCHTNDILKMLFSNGVPDNWEYDAYVNKCINKIGSHKIENLLKEPNKIRDERTSILEQTQELTISNYKTFIQTAECSRELFNEFNSIENSLEILLEHIPKFENKCQEFADDTNDISNLRKLNSLTLTRNAQLLEILELPQLMDSFIKDNLYEDALELAAYVRRVHNKHSDIPILKSILDDVDKSWLLMLQQLLAQLKTDLTLPKCLQIVGHLRRMEVFTESELRLKFLQARNVWLQSCLKGIPKDDANHHLHRTIEITRVNLFNIVTQYRAIFNDDEHSPLMSIKSGAVNQNVIFFNWLNDKITQFLHTLEEDLSQGVSSVETVLGQCMYFGLSFSRVGSDFRPLLVPIFIKSILNNFKNSVTNATKTFHKNMEKFTLINKTHQNISWKSKEVDPLQPPDTLLEFYPLAEYLNQILIIFNESKTCMPIGIVNDIVNTLEESLLIICNAILNLYAQEHQAFTSNSKDAFTRLCMCFCDDMIPYIQKCIHILFPPNNVALHMGVDVQTLHKENISFLNKNNIINPIKHLLPAKTEPVLSFNLNTINNYKENNVNNESENQDDNLLE